MVRDGTHPPGVEPLAKVVRAKLDALGWNPTQAVKATGLSSQHLSQILNKSEPYRREPSIDTMRKLAKIPTLSIEEVAQAVAESTGRPQAPEPNLEPISDLRKAVHALVNKVPEERLAHASQLLTTLL